MQRSTHDVEITILNGQHTPAAARAFVFDCCRHVRRCYLPNSNILSSTENGRTSRIFVLGRRQQHGARHCIRFAARRTPWSPLQVIHTAPCSRFASCGTPLRKPGDAACGCLTVSPYAVQEYQVGPRGRPAYSAPQRRHLAGANRAGTV